MTTLAPLKDRVALGTYKPCFTCHINEATVRSSTGCDICTDCQDRLIHGLDKCGMTLSMIARCCDTTVERVMQVLGADFYCDGCGRPADHCDGKGGRVPTEGDRDAPALLTDCCKEMFIDRHGEPYWGPGPFAEGY